MKLILRALLRVGVDVSIAESSWSWCRIGTGWYDGFGRLAANDLHNWLAVETGASNGKQNGVVKQKGSASSPALPVPVVSPLSTCKRHKNPAKFHWFILECNSDPIQFRSNRIPFSRAPNSLQIHSLLSVGAAELLQSLSISFFFRFRCCTTHSLIAFEV